MDPAAEAFRFVHARSDRNLRTRGPQMTPTQGWVAPSVCGSGNPAGERSSILVFMIMFASSPWRGVPPRTASQPKMQSSYSMSTVPCDVEQAAEAVFFLLGVPGPLSNEKFVFLEPAPRRGKNKATARFQRQTELATRCRVALLWFYLQSRTYVNRICCIHVSEPADLYFVPFPVEACDRLSSWSKTSWDRTSSPTASMTSSSWSLLHLYRFHTVTGCDR